MWEQSDSGPIQNSFRDYCYCIFVFMIIFHFVIGNVNSVLGLYLKLYVILYYSLVGCTHVVVMIWYIENIDISFSISIYRILSYRRKNIDFFDILRYLLYIMIFSIYRNILCQRFIFLLLHYQNNENKLRKWQTIQSKLTIVS